MKTNLFLPSALIILAVVLWLIFPVKSCSTLKPTITEDATTLHKTNDSLFDINSVNKKIIDSLKCILKQDSVKLLRVQQIIIKKNQDHIVYIDRISKLPIDSTIINLQGYFGDTTKITMIKLNGKELINITPSQALEADIEFSNVEYLEDINNELQSKIQILTHSDSICNQAINAYDNILFGKSVIIENKSKEIQWLSNVNADLKKKLKNQKTKTIGLSVISVIFAIIAIGK